MCVCVCVSHCLRACVSARLVRWGDTARRRITVISEEEEGKGRGEIRNCCSWQRERGSGGGGGGGSGGGVKGGLENQACEKSCFDGGRRCKFAGYSERRANPDHHHHPSSPASILSPSFPLSLPFSPPPPSLLPLLSQAKGLLS